MVVSGEQRRDSVIHIHTSILPQTLLPSRLACNIEWNSLCYTIGPCWLSILNISVCTWPSGHTSFSTLILTTMIQHVSFWSMSVFPGESVRSQWLTVNPDFPFWKGFPWNSPFSNKFFRNDWWCSAKLFIAWSTPTLIVYTNIWQPLTQPSHAGTKSHLKAVLNWELRKESWREIALGKENHFTSGREE